jgi:membrane protein
MNKISNLFIQTMRKWDEDNGINGSAALSFNLLLSLPALLLFIISFGGFFFKQEKFQADIINFASVTGNEVTINALNILFQQVPDYSSLSIGLILSSLLFIWSSSNVFIEIKNIIDRMWGIGTEKKKGFKYTIKSRLLSSATVFVFGAIIIIGNVFELLFFGISKRIDSIITIPIQAIQFSNFILNFSILIILFMYIYRVLPEDNIDLKSAFNGAFLTATLLTAGKYLFGSYIRYSNMTTIYGSIGSIMGFFLWIYVSAIIITIMVEFTKIHADIHKV